MLRRTNELTGYTLRAQDGEIGSVKDFYFDDEAWTVRYLVVDTGTWLPGRKVLISPMSLMNVDWDLKAVNVKLTKDQIEKSPDIDAHKPISRQHETDYYDYYGYPYYWGGPLTWGALPYPSYLPGLVETQTQASEIKAAQKQQNAEDQHLHSTEDVRGYYIEASDGNIGHVEDFILDDESWTVRYMIVDTANWWPGKKVIVAPKWIREVNWTDAKVHVDLNRENIKSAPEYDENVTRDYETQLYQHYGRQTYWE